VTDALPAVRLGIADDLLATRAGAALALAAPLRSLAGRLQALHQLVADGLELADAGHMGLRAQERMRLLLGARLRIGGELRLEAADLAPQLAAGGRFVGGAPDIRKPGALAGIGALGTELGGEDRPRELQRIDLRISGALDRVGGEPADVGRAAGGLGDEGAAALMGNDQPVALEAGVDRARGVDVDPGALGDLAHAREALARRQLAGRDQGPQLPGQLDADRQVLVALDEKRAGEGDSGHRRQRTR
jgi:hypothetical protein